jgi:hypothetical protein
MAGEMTVYCGSCGEALSATAQFCRSCGAPQEDFTAQQAVATPPAPAPPPPRPQPVAPSPGSWPQSNATGNPSVTGNRSAAYLAIAGGIGICFMVLYALVYVPLHHHFPLAFGEPLQAGDLLAFGFGALAIVLGALALKRAPASPARTGAVLMLAGVLSVALVLVWAFPETLHLDYYFGRPFYFGFVYFCELGKAHIGSGYENGYIQVPLLVSSAAVLGAGCLMAFARRRRAVGPA